MGNFNSSYTASDINTATLSINSAILPSTAIVIPSQTPFETEVLQVILPAEEFIVGYGALLDISVQPFTVTGEYTDGTLFDAVGKFVFVGRISGDWNSDGNVDITDLVYIVDFMFSGGPPPDIDSSESIDITDLVYLVDFMFLSGPEPVCN